MIEKGSTSNTTRPQICGVTPNASKDEHGRPYWSGYKTAPLHHFAEKNDVSTVALNTAGAGTRSWQLTTSTQMNVSQHPRCQYCANMATGIGRKHFSRVRC